MAARKSVPNVFYRLHPCKVPYAYHPSLAKKKGSRDPFSQHVIKITCC